MFLGSLKPDIRGDVTVDILKTRLALDNPCALNVFTLADAAPGEHFEDGIVVDSYDLVVIAQLQKDMQIRSADNTRACALIDAALAFRRAVELPDVAGSSSGPEPEPEPETKREMDDVEIARHGTGCPLTAPLSTPNCTTIMEHVCCTLVYK